MVKFMASKNRDSKIWITLEFDTLTIGLISFLGYSSFLQYLNPRTTQFISFVYFLVFLPFLYGQLYVMGDFLKAIEQKEVEDKEFEYGFADLMRTSTQCVYGLITVIMEKLEVIRLAKIERKKEKIQHEMDKRTQK